MALDFGRWGLHLDMSKADAALLKTYRNADRLFNQKGVNLNFKSSAMPLGKITGDFNKFNDSLEAATSRVLAFTATTTAIYGLTQAFARLFTDSVKLERQLASIDSILGTSRSNLTKFSDNLFDIANQTGLAFDTVADAATEFARQGLSMEATLKATSAAMTFVKISGLDAKQAVDALTASVNTFNSEALEHAEIVDIITNLDNNFAISAAGIAEGLKRVGGVASEAGVQMREVASLISVVQQVSARGATVISNGFKTIFTRLQREKVRDTLKGIGIETQDATGEFRNQIDVLKDLATAFETLSDAERAYISEQVAGVHQINTLQSTIKALRGEYSLYDKALKDAEDSTGSAAARLTILTDTTSSQLQKLKNGLTQFFAETGKVTIKPIADQLIGLGNVSLDNLISGLKANSQERGEEVGTAIGSAVIGGIQSILAGPGTVLFVATIGKLLKVLLFDVSKAIGVLSGVKKQSVVDSQLQKDVNFAIKTGNQLLVERLRLATSVNEKTVILNTLLASANQRQASLQVNALVAAGLSSAGRRAGTPRPGKAAGFVPNFNARAQEVMGAAEHGYQAGRVYKTMVHDGRGKSRLSVVNSAEDVINFTNSEGRKATLVVPPNGFGEGTTVAAKGFVPNFAPKIDKGLLKDIITANNPQGKKSVDLFRGRRSGKNPFERYDWRKHLNFDVQKRFKEVDIGDALGSHQSFSLLMHGQGNYGVPSSEKLPFLSTSLDKSVADRFTSRESLGFGKKKFPRSRIFTSRSYNDLTSRYGEEKVRDAIYKLSMAGGGRGMGFLANSFTKYRFFRGEREVSLLNGGFVPNFATNLALNKAKEREIRAGYDKSDVKVGKSISLVNPLNPDGYGVFNREEGSLAKGMSLAKRAGIDPKTKGLNLASGGIPNFASYREIQDLKRMLVNMSPKAIREMMGNPAALYAATDDRPPAFALPPGQRTLGKRLPLGGPPLPSTQSFRKSINIPNVSQYTGDTKRMNFLKTQLEAHRKALFENLADSERKIVKDRTDRISTLIDKTNLKRVTRQMPKDPLVRYPKAIRDKIMGVEKPGTFRSSGLRDFFMGSQDPNKAATRGRMAQGAFFASMAIPALAGSFLGPEEGRNKEEKTIGNVLESLGTVLSVAMLGGFTPVAVAAGVAVGALQFFSKEATNAAINFKALEKSADAVITANNAQVAAAESIINLSSQIDRLRAEDASPDKIARSELQLESNINKIRDDSVRKRLREDISEGERIDLLREFGEQKGKESEFARASLNAVKIQKQIRDAGVDSEGKFKENLLDSQFNALLDPVVDLLDPAKFTGRNAELFTKRIERGDFESAFQEFGEALGLTTSQATEAAKTLGFIGQVATQSQTDSLSKRLIDLQTAFNLVTSRRGGPNASAPNYNKIFSSAINNAFKNSELGRFESGLIKESELSLKEALNEFDLQSGKATPQEFELRKLLIARDRVQANSENDRAQILENAVKNILESVDLKSAKPGELSEIFSLTKSVLEGGGSDLTDLSSALQKTLKPDQIKEVLSKVSDSQQNVAQEIAKQTIIEQDNSRKLLSEVTLATKRLETGFRDIGKRTLMGQTGESLAILKARDPLQSVKRDTEIKKLTDELGRERDPSKQTRIRGQIDDLKLQKEIENSRRREAQIALTGKSNIQVDEVGIARTTERKARSTEALSLINAVNKKLGEQGSGRIGFSDKDIQKLEAAVSGGDFDVAREIVEAISARFISDVPLSSQSAQDSRAELRSLFDQLTSAIKEDSFDESITSLGSFDASVKDFASAVDRYASGGAASIKSNENLLTRAGEAQNDPLVKELANVDRTIKENIIYLSKLRQDDVTSPGQFKGEIGIIERRIARLTSTQGVLREKVARIFEQNKQLAFDPSGVTSSFDFSSSKLSGDALEKLKQTSEILKKSQGAEFRNAGLQLGQNIVQRTSEGSIDPKIINESNKRMTEFFKDNIGAITKLLEQKSKDSSSRQLDSNTQQIAANTQQLVDTVKDFTAAASRQSAAEIKQGAAEINARSQQNINIKVEVSGTNLTNEQVAQVTNQIEPIAERVIRDQYRNLPPTKK